MTPCQPVDSLTYPAALSAAGQRVINSNPLLPSPRVHGNGFIQLDLVPSGRIRLHVWGHPLIPSQSVRTGIHNHTYGITSRVLAGSLVDISWSFYPGVRDTPAGLAQAPEVYRAWEAVPRTGSDTELVPTGAVGVVRAYGAAYLGRNARPTYDILAGQYHSTLVVGPAATLMEKTGVDQLGPRPRILVPIDEEPDNTFDRNAFDPTLLYGIIAEVYPGWLRLLDNNGRV